MSTAREDADPDGSDDEDVKGRSSHGRGRRSRPRLWVEVDEDGEPLPLDEKQTARLRERGLNLCLWHLGQGARTRAQLRDALARKGVPEDIATSVLDTLTDYNYLNDDTYARHYVESRHTSQRKGARAIRYELLRKGVAPGTIDQALEQITPESEMDNARALVARKLPSTRSLDRNKRVNRLVGMLTRKGYSPSLSFQVVREALDGESPEDDYEPR